ncbi:uncharacterized protein BDCG_08400 [Blastomyces dermatitidis ER-3]|uniref:Uncharacterized protein n=1 Tax=Ajellomyces dermatitidis (strain ER-3 / ATCC MYA-2586) TaxID=559297 RepID=A0ABP2EPM2_AJEDR|nr:uncharacterized protein BDCG_08400 [Blastomyces dermatitidis ER-3]EEQ85131.2 hypothetical protein BDCG_08400 [Blastomyces dermatitidis ER-3]
MLFPAVYYKNLCTFVLSTHPGMIKELKIYNHMPSSVTSNPSRKRQHPEPHPSDRSRFRKRQKLNVSASAYWDNLSKIWLTKDALDELDRRNSHLKPLKNHHQPLTQQFHTELRKHCNPFQFAPAFLRDCAACSKQIKRVSRLGGPDLTDLRNYPKPENFLEKAMSSRSRSRKRRAGSPPSTRADTKGTTKSTSTTPYNHTHASKEQPVTTSVIPIIEGDIDDPKCAGGGYPLGNLAPLTDGTLAQAKSDHFYGARPEQLDCQICNKLSDHIIPSTQDDLPMVPNFFLEAKGPDGSLAVATRQACYDGALGARGMHALQSYQQDGSTYDNNAYTLTSTYHGGTLKLYTTHLTEPEGLGRHPEYIMTQLKGWSMTSDPGTFRHGASAYRNARDWAKERRDEFIMAANETHAKAQSQLLHSTSQRQTASEAALTLDNSDLSTLSDHTEYQDTQWSFADTTEEGGGESQILSRHTKKPRVGSIVEALQTIRRHTSIMSTRTTRTRKIKGSKPGSVDTRYGSDSSSATEQNDSIDQGTTMAERAEQQSSFDSWENISLSSTDSMRPTSPVPVTHIWELAAHDSIHCEENTAEEAVHIILSGNPLNLQPLRCMYKSLSQEEVSYIRKRLEEYTEEVRQHIHKLDDFDCAVILADARTLFLYIALLKLMIKIQQTEPQSKKRTMQPAGDAGQGNCGKRRRRH